MTKTRTLKSCLTGNHHGQFGSGGGGSDPSTDHNLGFASMFYRHCLIPRLCSCNLRVSFVNAPLGGGSWSFRAAILPNLPMLCLILIFRFTMSGLTDVQ